MSLETRKIEDKGPTKQHDSGQALYLGVRIYKPETDLKAAVLLLPYSLLDVNNDESKS